MKLAFIGLAAFLAAAAFYSYSSALIASRSYRILVSEQTSIGNTLPKTGGSYSLLGSTGQLGFGSVSGGRYSVNWGIVNSWRPPQANVSTAHVYPNPCSLRDNCNGVTFTRLTLHTDIKIYTISGEKVRTIEKNSNIDSTGWDLRTDGGETVSSGLYLYVIKGEGSVKQGKIIVVR
ncbi:MAG: T9SS type A sorting domain-containing protein [Elusimicrobia bacterium]|nr:T9SS type A sorting domain-containing protein [Elusimicrobiota bacterium]